MFLARLAVKYKQCGLCVNKIGYPWLRGTTRYLGRKQHACCHVGEVEMMKSEPSEAWLEVPTTFFSAFKDTCSSSLKYHISHPDAGYESTFHNHSSPFGHLSLQGRSCLSCFTLPTNPASLVGEK